MSFDGLGSTNSLGDLRSEFDSLSQCCLSGERERFDPVRVVAHWSNRAEPNKYGYFDGYGVVIFENGDGSFGVLEDAEDTTGHGCRCSASIAWFASEEMAWRLGIPAKEADPSDSDMRAGLERNGFTGPLGTDEIKETP